MAYVMAIDTLFPDPSPLKDLNVRKALIMSVDRDSIAKSLYKGFAQTAQSPIPIVMLGYDPSVTALPYDPDKAKQMLSDAGAAGMAVTLNSYSATSSIPDVDKLATTIASFWNQIGIKTTLAITDAGTYLPAWRARQLKSTGLIAGPTYYYVEPSRMTASFFSTAAPYAATSDPTLDALATQINQATDLTKRDGPRPPAERPAQHAAVGHADDHGVVAGRDGPERRQLDPDGGLPVLRPALLAASQVVRRRAPVRARSDRAGHHRLVGGLDGRVPAQPSEREHGRSHGAPGRAAGDGEADREEPRSRQAAHRAIRAVPA